jgi:hypothetical protein
LRPTASTLNLPPDKPLKPLRGVVKPVPSSIEVRKASADGSNQPRSLEPRGKASFFVISIRSARVDQRTMPVTGYTLAVGSAAALTLGLVYLNYFDKRARAAGDTRMQIAKEDARQNVGRGEFRPGK